MTELERLFLARQPILDSNGTLIGYELLFRDSTTNRADTVTPGLATADVVCKAFTELGLATALGGHKAFIIADAEFLRHEAIEALPSHAVVLEVDAALAAEPDVLERCAALGAKGYTFCLMHLNELDESVAALLKLSSYIKLNINDCDATLLKRLLALPPEFRPVTIASRVETKADYQSACDLGFHFFQGYYFAEPTVVEGRRVDPGMRGLMHIINLLNRDAEINEIEQAFKGEAALTVKLLRLTNSAGVGLRIRIGSVRQAITVIGRFHIQRWLQLLLYSQSGGADFARNPLMQYAALKGCFMEGLVRRGFPGQGNLADLAFLTGLLSLMPAALGMPMTDILEQLAIAPQLRNALLQHEGDLGVLLELTDCFDNDDPHGVNAALTRLGKVLGHDALNACLTEAIAWVQTLADEE